ncbi:MAG: hypothetical protein JO243_05275 [Solirubrobacterales bacterium]|nr:hypothetical protein [Solirubrobacterales bacterium]
MAKQRKRQREKLSAPTSEYRDSEGNILTLRGSLTPGARREYGDILAGGLEREDAWQRATELLFERLAVSWTISGLEITRQKELLGRYRMASTDERRFVRATLREHAAEHFPELQAP